MDNGYSPELQKSVDDFLKKRKDEAIIEIVPEEVFTVEEEITAETALQKWHEYQNSEEEKAQKQKQFEFEQEEEIQRYQQEEEIARKQAEECKLMEKARVKKARKEKSFYPRRRFFLRQYTHIFLKLEIYTKFSDFFELVVPPSFDEIAFNSAFENFYFSISSERKNINYGLSFLDVEIERDVFCIDNRLSTEYFSKDEIENIGTTELKNKILMRIFENFLEAESYRCVVGILKDYKLTLQYLTKFVEEFKARSIQKTIYGIFSQKVHEKLIEVISSELDEVYFYDQVEDDSEKMIILENTVLNFKHLDRVTLDETLLRDLEITNETFTLKFNEEYINAKFKVIFDNLKMHSHVIHETIKADVLVLDFNLLEDYDHTGYMLIGRSSVKSIENASLNYFTHGMLDGLTAVIISEIFMDKGEKENKSRKLKILKNLEKYTCEEEYINHFPSSLLALLRLLVEHHKNRHIVLMVYIAHELCLSRLEAWNLSQVLGLNSRDTFNLYFNDFYTVIHPNYKYIMDTQHKPLLTT